MLEGGSLAGVSVGQNAIVSAGAHRGCVCLRGFGPTVHLVQAACTCAGGGGGASRVKWEGAQGTEGVQP